MTRGELREHYVTVRKMIESERVSRANAGKADPFNVSVVSVAECDAALTALAAMGNALANLLPPEGPVAIQEVLFDVPETALR